MIILLFIPMVMLAVTSFVRSVNSTPPNSINVVYNHHQYKQSGDYLLWSDIPEAAFAKKEGRRDFIKHYRTLKLDTAVLNQILAQPVDDSNSIRDTKSIISLPLPDGSFARFRFAYSPTMSSESKNKNIRTYVGQGADDIYLASAFDVTTEGFHAMITQQNLVIYIEPYTQKDFLHYICYYKHDVIPGKRKPFEEHAPVKH